MVLFAVCTAGCIVARERVNADCGWTHDAPAPLDAGTASDERHLRDDATVAEELAIRHADTTRGFRSGRYAGRDEYVRTRERCLTTLFGVIATNHRVDAQQVRAMLGRRSIGSDIAAVFLPMAVLFCVAANGAVRGIHRRFTPDERFARLAATLAASLVLTLAGYLVGSIWSFVFEEELRLGSNHLSYRASFLPWSRHPVAVMTAGLVLFTAVALVRARAAASPADAEREVVDGSVLRW